MPIHILKADGGAISFDASIEFPAQTILSGPAASVMGSIVYASDQEDVVVLDIRGTTTDIAVLIKKAPVFDPLGIKLGRYKTLIRSLKGSSIGIGGDSAVRIENGDLAIGPERLGPAMGYGGSVLTPTDAMFVLGMIKDGDREKAVKGVAPVAAELGVSIEEAAFNIFDLTCKKILINVRDLINQINSKPVYTIHDFLEGYKVNPTKMLVLGGPAPYFAGHLEKLSDFKVSVVPGWKTANATGAALAKTTCEVTLFADTQQGIVAAPEENFTKTITNRFSKTDAVDMAFDLLKKKAVQRGAGTGNIETEVVEDLQFNMVRGFHTTGKNIRVKVQIKPGLIHDYDSMLYASRIS